MAMQPSANDAARMAVTPTTCRSMLLLVLVCSSFVHVTSYKPRMQHQPYQQHLQQQAPLVEKANPQPQVQTFLAEHHVGEEQQHGEWGAEHHHELEHHGVHDHHEAEHHDFHGDHELEHHEFHGDEMHHDEHELYRLHHYTEAHAPQHQTDDHDDQHFAHDAPRLHTVVHELAKKMQAKEECRIGDLAAKIQSSRTLSRLLSGCGLKEASSLELSQLLKQLLDEDLGRRAKEDAKTAGHRVQRHGSYTVLFLLVLAAAAWAAQLATRAYFPKLSKSRSLPRHLPMSLHQHIL